MASKVRKKGRKKKKLSLKRAAQLLAKTIYKHLVKLPEEERERDIAAFERAVAKKLKKLRAKRWPGHGTKTARLRRPRQKAGGRHSVVGKNRA